MSVFFAAGAIPAFMTEAVALLVAGAIIAYICHRFGLVPIVGFLIAGVVIGPNGLRLVRDQALVDAAAEVGVILLLYTIGIEFSLEKLARIKRLIFVGGGLQVGLATLLTMAVLAAFGVGWQVGLFTGFLVALSSTAIVLKLLADKGETNDSHGQVALGLLIFQDLAIIVMVLLIPVLSGSGGSGYEIFFALAKAAIIILVVLLFARRLMPPMLEMVARTCSPELFLLTVIAVCFGTAYLTSLAGVSLSLGAFLAGLLVSESRFSEHALSEILPLQILFSATFFVSVGMLLDVVFLVNNLPLVAGSIALVLVVKIITTAIGVRVLNYKTPVVAASGLMLAQIGEFSFVLERAGREVGLSPAGLGAAGSQTFIASSVVLMVATPLLMRFGSQLAGKMEANQAARARANIERANGETETTTKDLPTLENHVIVAGYGQAARSLVRVLGESGVPFVITTLSPHGATEAEGEGRIVLRGDSTKQRTLELAGIARARVLVIADDEPITAGRIASVARTLNSNLRVIIRTRYAADINTLTAMGANRVVAEEQESFIKLFGEVLSDYDFTPEVIAGHETDFRRDAQPATISNIESQHQVPSNFQMNRDTLSNSDDNNHKNQVDTERVIELHLTEQAAACSHVAQTRPVVPGARGCEECLRVGDTWVHLRVCMTCGHVGCCESSKNKHALQHFTEINHPIIASLEPDEDWAWCYADKTYL